MWRAAGLFRTREGLRNAVTILERAYAYREAGIEGLTFSMPDVHDLEAVTLAGQTLAPVFNSQR